MTARREVPDGFRPSASQTAEATPVIPETTTDSAAGAQRAVPSGSGGSPKLTHTMSRTEAVRQDVRRLKSVTLGRMGRIFKTRTPVVGESVLDAVSRSVSRTTATKASTHKRDKHNSALPPRVPFSSMATNDPPELPASEKLADKTPDLEYSY
ncbi:hypothetical protein EAI_14575 [Harpegnathos saltator]|uniref:Uncharacterized protein n=1 Tax=Harpegnathos saltator TaxID=610380 RepID=E2BFV9_HARSA|nr:hypothetical protein EAI_14575 [Harpegnathos saltator]